MRWRGAASHNTRTIPLPVLPFHRTAPENPGRSPDRENPFQFQEASGQAQA